MEKGRKQRFLEAGEGLFSLHGYKDVSIEDITSHLGVATGSFYSCFTTKEAFYSKILDVIEARGKRMAGRVVARFQSPMNQLKALYRFTTLGILKNRILRGILTEDKRYLYPGWMERQASESSLRHYIEGQFTEILRHGGNRRVFRSGLFHDPKRMVVSLFDTILLNLESDDISDLMDDILLLLERGLKRRLRLRQRDERRDRRTIQSEKLRL